jgi:hypothetical protein
MKSTHLRTWFSKSSLGRQHRNWRSCRLTGLYPLVADFLSFPAVITNGYPIIDANVGMTRDRMRGFPGELDRQGFHANCRNVFEALRPLTLIYSSHRPCFCCQDHRIVPSFSTVFSVAPCFSWLHLGSIKRPYKLRDFQPRPPPGLLPLKLYEAHFTKNGSKIRGNAYRDD